MTYLHDPIMPASIVPNDKMRFATREDAYDFYCYYARKAGFDVRITVTRKTVGVFSCNKQGICEFYKPGQDRKREKMSKRCDCKASVKAKWNKKNGYWFFDWIRLEHCHPLEPSPRMVQFMNAHKNKDETVMEMVDTMQRCDVPHNATVNMLSEIYGGRQNLTFTEMDLKNSCKC
ncbi:hypothetical protein ACP4OV_031542 [Aristida adscensionis]